RSKGKIFFLFVDDTGDVGAEGAERLDPSSNAKRIKETIERLIARGKADEGLQVEIHCRQGDFVQEVRRFVRDHHINEIVLALPEEHKQSDAHMNKDVQPLLQLTHCRIVTVRPKSKGT
ncbi:MAG: hypothetical protein R6V46_01005, partial [Desulfatiglandaceae bacterium]